MRNGIIHYAICHSKLFVHRTITENELQRKIDGKEVKKTRMWANAQPDGRPAEHRWRPLFNAAKFG